MKKKSNFHDKNESPSSNKKRDYETKHELERRVESNFEMFNSHGKTDTDDVDVEDNRSSTSLLNETTDKEENTTTIETAIKIVLSKSSDKIKVESVSAAAHVSSSGQSETTTESVEIHDIPNQDQEESAVIPDIKSAPLESPTVTSEQSRKRPRHKTRKKSRKRRSTKSDSSLASPDAQRHRSTSKKRRKKKTSSIKSRRPKRNAPMKPMVVKEEGTENDGNLPESREEDFDIDQAFWKSSSPKRETIVDDSANVSIFDDLPPSPDSRISLPCRRVGLDHFDVTRSSIVFKTWGRFCVHESLSYSQMLTDRSRSLGRAIIFDSLFTPLQRREQESMFLRGYRNSAYLKDRFSPMKLLKHGTFSEVFLVKDRETGRQVIQKNVYIQKCDITKNTAAILKEKDILDGLKSHWVVKSHSSFRANRAESVADFFAFVLEYVPGGNWDSLTEYFHSEVVKVRRETRSCESIWSELIRSSMQKSTNCQGGQYFWDDVRFLCRQLICAVVYLHNSGIHYCDLKPTSVLIDINGHVKLINFGLISFLRRMQTNNKFRYMGICETERLLDDNLRHQYDHALNRIEDGFPEPEEILFDLDQSFSIAKEITDDTNSWYWCAPECIDESFANRFLVDRFTSVSDWWSVGCLIFQIIVGVPPFDSFLDMEPNDVFDNIVSMSSELLYPENLNWILPCNQLPHAFARELIEGFLRDPCSRFGNDFSAVDDKDDEEESGRNILRTNFFREFNEIDMVNYRIIARVEDRNAFPVLHRN